MIYNRNREQIEFMGREGAHILQDTENIRLVRVLNLFDLFVLKDDISLAPHLTRDGFWESWVTSWFTKWIRPGMTVLDIGANSGYYTLLAEKLVGRHGHVIAYEPNPVYAELLRQTRNANRGNFKIREVALSDEVGTAHLYVPDNYHGSASIMSNFGHFKIKRKYKVKKTTLDKEAQNLVFAHHDIVKIDAESAEETIWNGGHSVWDCVHHTTIVMEYTPNAYSDAFLDELFKWGDVFAIQSDGEEERVSREWIRDQPDLVMLVVRKK